VFVIIEKFDVNRETCDEVYKAFTSIDDNIVTLVADSAVVVYL
jgi:hypothetical protein